MQFPSRNFILIPLSFFPFRYAESLGVISNFIAESQYEILFYPNPKHEFEFYPIPGVEFTEKVSLSLGKVSERSACPPLFLPVHD